VTLSDEPAITFVPESEPIPEAPLLTSVSVDEEGLLLEWDIENGEFIANFIIYRGSGRFALTQFDSVAAESRIYIDIDLLSGSSFYAVSAINNDGEEGERSNIISFVNDNLSATSDWQLASIPLGKTTVETDLATIFSYSDRYEVTESLQHSMGYWIKTRTFDTELIPAVGSGLDSTSIQLREGWNLIGSLADTISVASISDPDGILTAAPVYGFTNKQYQEISLLAPNQGYWIFASDSGRIDLSIHTEIPETDAEAETGDIEIAPVVLTGLTSNPVITFSNGEESAEIIISNSYLSQEEQYRYLMPPIAPEPLLDVRTTEHTRLMNDEPVTLQIRSGQYPIHLEVDGMEENFEYAYRLTVEKDGNRRSIDLVPGQSNVLTSNYDFIRLEKIHVDELITEHRLMPNYPNPFNPTTTIHYQLREQSQVRIEVYDVIGRRVQTLANEVQYSGEYRVNFDARSLASGVYIIRFMAGNHMDIRKMTLIK
jgi:hypothetical protein